MKHSPGLNHPNRSPEQVMADRLCNSVNDLTDKLTLVRVFLECSLRELNRINDRIPGTGESRDVYSAIEELHDSLDAAMSDHLSHAESELDEWCKLEAEREYLRPAMGEKR